MEQELEELFFCDRRGGHGRRRLRLGFRVTLVLVTVFPDKMSSAETPCYTVVFEDSSEHPTTQELKSALERGSEEVKIDTLRKILVQAINGNPQVTVTVF
jgi:hypothetical protein